ncbi:DNRLRE domain-containing protein [Jonesiaceae bacterium BS-20]|uniref:DNRLRE domain-containing protein n=1 Tax=Jonesiaceae bacterium BS-20 TaxID=3120821 RepID=A0AAU7DV13_9MICO
MSPILGKKITSATLKLYQFHSWSCTAKPWVVGSTATTSASTVWSNQPGLVKNYVTVTDAKGYSSSCAAGWSSANVTTLMQDYANGTVASRGIRLAASSETDNFGWKKFRSGNATSNKPTLSVTYNSYPNKATTVLLTPGQYQWFGTAPNRTLFVRNATPTITAVVSDPDGGNVRAQFHVTNNTTGAVIANWGSGNYVASGGTSSYRLPTLVNGHTYTFKVRGSDGTLASKAETIPGETAGKFTVDLVAPTLPKVTSNKYTDGGWLGTAATGTTFALESATDTSYFEVKKDKGAVERVNASAGKASVSWSPGAGYHTLKVKAVDRAGLASGEKTFAFGAGGVALTSQIGGLKSTDRFTTTLSGPPSAQDGTATATTYVREVGTTTASDNSVNGGAGAPWTEVAGSAKAFNGSYSATWSATPFATSKGLERRVMAIEVQVCVKYVATGGATTTKCSWNSAAPAVQKPTVIRVPHAFGDNYPTADAGPGQVALWTGEYNYSETDVSVPGYAGDLSMSRTYSSLSGVDNDSVFGPGWQANFDGTDIGVAGWEVFDSTAQDGVIALVDAEGEPLVYQHTSGIKGDRKAGKYDPIDDDTAEYGATLELLTDRVTLVFTEDDGTKTFFAFANSTWAPSKIQEPGSTKATTFTRNTNGTVARILAPTPDGVTCTASAPLLAPGCRALDITYTSVSGKQRVDTVSYVAYDPAKPGGAGMASVQIAKYGYEPAAPHRLVKVTYPHTADASGPASARSVNYTYGPGVSSSGQPLLETLKPAGLQPFSLVWGKSVHDPKSLLAVSRTAPSGGSQVQQSRFAYGIPLTGQGNLPTIDAAMASRYGQSAPAVYGAAVFSADRSVATGDLNQIVMPSADDWRYADLQYTDLDGRVVNTANFGSGTWQFTAADYDAKGNEIRSLDERATAQLRDVNANGELGQTDIDTYATITKYNEETPTNPEGTLITDVWTPAVNTDTGLVRLHTHTNYDQGAPNGGINPDTELPYRLPTEVIVTQVPAGDDASTPVVLSRSTTGYDPVDGAAATGNTSGWKHGVSTLVTNHIDNAADNIITKSVLDGEGRVVKSVEPGSNGTDAGTSLAGFYTAGPQTGVFAACGNKPQWAGMNCMTTTGEGTPTVPSTMTAYSMFMAPALVTETLGTAKRITTTTFNNAGQPTKVATQVQGVAGSVAMGSTETVYDQATGDATTTISRNSAGTETGRITTQADGWGRATTYTDNHGKTSTTTYDALSRVVTFTDSAGKTTTNTYGDANERRGHLTKTDTTGVGTFTAMYDSIGDMTSQTLAGGKVTQHIVREPRSGAVTSMSYTIQPTTGDPVEVLAWSMTNDVQDRITAIESQANGAPVIDEETGEIIGFGSLSRTQQFEFDKANRLTTVNDNAGGVCATRTYGFSTRGHRLSLGEATKTCEDTEPATTSNKTWAYDQADRMQTGANSSGIYQYDPLGRQTKLPAIDTPQGTAAGDLTITYFDDDSARSITQNGVTTTYDLDPAGRRSTSTTTSNGGTSTTKRYYADGSDNPTWATINDGFNPEKMTWYGGDIGGSLGIEITDTTKTLTLNDPLGSVATTIDITNSTQTPTMGPVGTYDEYGISITQAGSTGALNYGWLGGKERAQDTTGLILMGARLYNNISGHFTSVDPVPGGNTTAYTYPQDPINEFDLDGNLKIAKWAKKAYKATRKVVQKGARFLTDNKYAKGALAACGFIPGKLGTACNGVTAVSYYIQGRKKEGNRAVAAMLYSAAGGGAVKVLGGLGRNSWSRAAGRANKSTFYRGATRTQLRRYDLGVRQSKYLVEQTVGYRISNPKRRR